MFYVYSYSTPPKKNKSNNLFIVLVQRLNLLLVKQTAQFLDSLLRRSMPYIEKMPMPQRNCLNVCSIMGIV